MKTVTTMVSSSAMPHQPDEKLVASTNKMDESEFSKVSRRGTATTTTSSSSKEDVISPPKTGKAHRRVSFTTDTPMADHALPPVVVVDDANGFSASSNATTDEAITATTNHTSLQVQVMTAEEEEELWNSATACMSPNCNTKRTPSLSSLQATPHHSNQNNHTPTGNLQVTSHSFPHHHHLHHHHHHQQQPPRMSIMSPYRSNPTPCSRRSSIASSRRSSLDSCSSHSSAISSSCYSAASLASVLSFKDEAFQRAKLLTCLEWLSRHISSHLVQQLMQQVQQQQQEHQTVMEGPSPSSNRRRSTSAIRLLQQNTISSSKRTTPTAQQRRHSQPEPSAVARSSRSNKLPMPSKRPRCSFVHCETATSSSSSSGSDSDEQRRQQQRLLKTQASLDRLSSQEMISSDDDDQADGGDEMAVLGYESCTSLSSWAAADNDRPAHIPLPPPQPHRTALLLVDISGFTKLSTTLPLQALSQTINAYFQRIIECIQEYGGDVVKFAGDAVMAAWRQDDDDAGDDQIPKTLFREEKQPSARAQHIHVVQIATACACQIIERCSDYHVYQHQVISSPNKNTVEQDDPNALLATLNVHCGVGYGTMVGFHAGDETRREYLLLGKPIAKAADAIALGRGGEVVAAPEAYEILAGSSSSSSSSSSENERGDPGNKPQVIFSSRRDRFETTLNLLDRDMLLMSPPESTRGRNDTKWTDALESWELPALKKLQQHMSLYVHAAVIESELFTTIYHSHRTAAAAASAAFFDSESDRSVSSQEQQRQQLEHDQRVHQSEAEIRKVFTLFLQPLVSVDITGDPVQDDTVMTTLNEIMVLANRELARFKGHLRQFIVDDKGVVLIANFGLRGSMFPRMIENHAMPFAASLQSVLKSELGVECRMGGTYGNAYCGIVGGLERHEFSILGPAVNLSARLMGNPENHGFLVEQGVRGEAHGWQFNAREPVRAKGYASPVSIFEPVMHKRSPWTRPHRGFVGREEELDLILEFSDEVVSSGCSSARMALISGASGFGKSSLLSETVNRIQQQCLKQKHSQLVLGQVCCEDDLFRPMSVLGPILLDALCKTGHSKPQTASEDDQSSIAAIETVHSPAGTALCCNAETAVALEQFYAACERVGICEEDVEAIHSLVFHHEWPEKEQGLHEKDEMASSQRLSPDEQDEIARSLVSILLQTTVSVDLVLLGIDDISLMDELSWKVLHLWFEHACNLVIIGTSKHVTCKDLNIEPSFWDYLFSAGMLLNRFLHVELPPMNEGDIQRLVALTKVPTACTDSQAIRRTSSAEIGFAHEVYIQSGGNPRLAASMIERFSGDVVDSSEETFDESSLREGIKKVASADASETLGFNEHMLHRLDSLPAVVRTHLNLCAMLGDSFSIADVVLVMERYRGVEEESKEEHAEFVHDALNEAVWHSILSLEGELMQDEAVEIFPKGQVGVARYRFTHELWREKILELTLDSWQQDMHRLIEESLKVGHKEL